LTTPEGRTDANCWVVDLFVGNDEYLERNWSDLPESFKDILLEYGRRTT
jgi:hypothetical protein